jgi:hypothetical protein
MVESRSSGYNERSWVEGIAREFRRDREDELGVSFPARKSCGART